MRRTQDEYKSLENKPKKDAEKHILEINNIYLKRLETEEKYGHVKETELYKEKEKVFLKTFDALTRLNKIIKKNIDLRNEEVHGLMKAKMVISEEKNSNYVRFGIKPKQY